MVSCVQSGYHKQFMVVKFLRLQLTRYKIHLRMDHPTEHSCSSSNAACCSSLLRHLAPAAALSLHTAHCPASCEAYSRCPSVPTLLSCCSSGCWSDCTRGCARSCTRSTMAVQSHHIQALRGLRGRHRRERIPQRWAHVLRPTLKLKLMMALKLEASLPLATAC